MSRHEEEEREELFVWTTFLCLNALLLSRVTVVREGMSVNEDRKNGTTLQGDGTRTEECAAEYCFGSERGEFGQVYSSAQCCETTSHDQLTRLDII